MNEAYNNMTIEQLEAEIAQRNIARQAIKDEQSALQAILTQKATQANAERLLSGMDDAQKAALLQAIQGNGIKSEEAVKGLS